MVTRSVLISPIERVARSVSRVKLASGAKDVDGPARTVDLWRDRPLEPPPSVQFVLCFEESSDGDPIPGSDGSFAVGFREEFGMVEIRRAQVREIVTGLEKLLRAFQKMARDGSS
jgi:hypothetical protein